MVVEPKEDNEEGDVEISHIRARSIAPNEYQASHALARESMDQVPANPDVEAGGESTILDAPDTRRCIKLSSQLHLGPLCVQ